MVPEYVTLPKLQGEEATLTEGDLFVKSAGLINEKML